ncbi:MAG: hypothetical protein ACRD21_09330 [Vicinamibacteria bacterium]
MSRILSMTMADERTARRSHLEAMAYLGGTVWLVIGVGMAFLLLRVLSHELLSSLVAVLTPLALLAGR